MVSRDKHIKERALLRLGREISDEDLAGIRASLKRGEFKLTKKVHAGRYQGRVRFGNELLRVIVSDTMDLVTILPTSKEGHVFKIGQTVGYKGNKL